MRTGLKSMFGLYERLVNKEEKLAVIGLGYVGVPLAVAFSKKVNTTGFDVDAGKINTYKLGIDPTKEVGDAELCNCTVDFTSDEARLKEAKFHIVAVPTPISNDNSPDLTYVIAASRTIGRNLQKAQ